MLYLMKLAQSCKIKCQRMQMKKIYLPKDWIQPKGLSNDNIIRDIKQGVSTRRRIVFCEHVAFVSQIEPKNVNDALNDSNWIVVMQDELNQFIRNDVWFLVSKTNDMNII